MIKLIRPFTTAVVIGLFCTILAGCGSGDPSGTVVAQVGKTKISRAMLSSWMEAVAGGDYFEHVSRVLPRGLVSDPPNYTRCVATAEEVAPKSPSGHAETPHAQLVSKCHELNGALKEQALMLLISLEGSVEEGAAEHIGPTTAEVNKFFARVKAEQFPTQAKYATFLADHDWTPEVEILQLKRNIVATKMAAKYGPTFKARYGAGWERPYFLYIFKKTKQWTARTTCSPGYIVETCKEYNTSRPPSNSAPAVMLEELADVS